MQVSCLKLIRYDFFLNILQPLFKTLILFLISHVQPSTLGNCVKDESNQSEANANTEQRRPELNKCGALNYQGAPASGTTWKCKWNHHNYN